MLPTKLIFDKKYFEYSEFVDESNVIFLTDENLFSIYREFFIDKKVIIMPPGEDSKSFSQVEIIIEKLLDLNASRSTYLIGFGGGVVSDITGFVASIFMRGIKFGFISTSLLSQVDAGLGGKNGINFLRKKNIIGTFSHPEFIIYDFDLLKTLPFEEVKNGIVEMIKIFILFDEKMFFECESNFNDILDVESDFLKKSIRRAIQLKKQVVEKDFHDKSIRNLLNFGHTLGHIIESNENLKHGEAVGIGMNLACKISVELGLLSWKSYLRIKNLMERLSLPIETNLNPEFLIHNLQFDKKKSIDKINFILIKEIGEPFMKKFSIDELGDLIWKIQKFV